MSSGGNDWQDRLQKEENEIDQVLSDFTIDQLRSAIKRRVSKEIDQKLAEYKKQLEKQLNEKS